MQEQYFTCLLPVVNLRSLTVNIHVCTLNFLTAHRFIVLGYLYVKRSQEDSWTKMRSRCTIPPLARAAVAEFIGTFVLVTIGSGSVAQSQLTDGAKGNYFTINWGWAIGCSLGILISAKASGGHLNPAVTMALAVGKDFPWKRLPVYWCAQYLGSLAASGTVLGVYYEAIAMYKIDGQFRINANASEPGSAAIFANYPAAYSSVITGLMEEILCTTIFMIVICVVTNPKHLKVPSYLQPLYIGFTLLAVGVAYGSNGGYALNPARDLAPRLVSYLGGWGTRVFSFRGYNWFWIFLVGPHVGAILGVGIFHFLILEKDHTLQATSEINSSQAPILEYEYQVDNGMENRQNFSKLLEQRLPYRSDENAGSNIITQI